MAKQEFDFLGLGRMAKAKRLAENSSSKDPFGYRLEYDRVRNEFRLKISGIIAVAIAAGLLLVK